MGQRRVVHLTYREWDSWRVPTEVRFWNRLAKELFELPALLGRRYSHSSLVYFLNLPSKHALSLACSSGRSLLGREVVYALPFPPDFHHIYLSDIRGNPDRHQIQSSN